MELHYNRLFLLWHFRRDDYSSQVILRNSLSSRKCCSNGSSLLELSPKLQSERSDQFVDFEDGSGKNVTAGTGRLVSVVTSGEDRLDQLGLFENVLIGELISEHNVPRESHRGAGSHFGPLLLTLRFIFVKFTDDQIGSFCRGEVAKNRK